MLKNILIFLFFLGMAQAALSILPPSPANNSIQNSNLTTFNWSSTGLVCTASVLMLNKTGQILPIINQTYLTCNQSQSIVLSNGSYVWAVQTVAIPPENSGLLYFNVSPFVLSNLTYPTTNSILDIADSCRIGASMTATDDINDSVSRTGVYTLYFNNGTDYILAQTITGPYSGSVNFTNISKSGVYRVNATANAGGVTNSTSTSTITVVGVTMCKDKTQEVSEVSILAAIVIFAGLFFVALAYHAYVKKERDYILALLFTNLSLILLIGGFVMAMSAAQMAGDFASGVVLSTLYLGLLWAWEAVTFLSPPLILFLGLGFTALALLGIKLKAGDYHFGAE